MKISITTGINHTVNDKFAFRVDDLKMNYGKYYYNDLNKLKDTIIPILNECIYLEDIQQLYQILYKKNSQEEIELNSAMCLYPIYQKTSKANFEMANYIGNKLLYQQEFTPDNLTNSNNAYFRGLTADLKYTGNKETGDSVSSIVSVTNLNNKESLVNRMTFISNQYVGTKELRVWTEKVSRINGVTKIEKIGEYKTINLSASPVSQLSSSYMMTKMQQENVYDDYITYMDEKTSYDKQQRKLEQDRQFAYEEALKENPELTYEEFMSLQPMTLNLVEEPQPSQALKDFMEKYL